MAHWLPFVFVSLAEWVCSWRAFRRQQWSAMFWWLGWWGLTLLTLTPVTVSFGSDLHGITTHWWGGGVWVFTPLQPASVDWSFWLNIVMTIPQGRLLAWRWPHLRWWQAALAGLGIGLTLEGTQAVANAWASVGRWVDINDVLTNTLGAWLGLGLGKIRHQFMTGSKRD